MKRSLVLLALILLSVPSMAKPISIKGRVLGSDARPMKSASIALASPENAMKEPTFIAVGADGHFEYTVERPGIYWIIAHGVDHELGRQPVLLADYSDVTLDVTLGTYTFNTKFDSVRVIGEFNDFSFDSATVSMTLLRNGTLVAEIPWKGKKLSYQLLGVAPEHSINGTVGGEFEYDGGGDYRSSVAVSKGIARIVFDPRKLPASGRQFAVASPDKSSNVATYLRINADIDRRRDAMRSAAMAWQTAGNDMKDWKYDNASELKAIATELAGERDAFTRQLLLVSYLDAQSNTGRDSTIAQMATREIDPESVIWERDPAAIYVMYRLAGSLKTPLTIDEYVERASTKHTAKSVRAQLTMMQLQTAHYAKDTVTEAAMYKRLMEDYSDTYYATMARAEFAPDRAIQVGRKIPEFSFVSLNDPSITYSNETMLGRYYLIDFWATWCGPCIGEMGNLHEAYEKYHARNFDILSLSFDASPNEVTKFVAKKWKMPWRHAFVDGGFENPSSVRFGVTGIPKPILVGPDGTIVATEEVLRGESLEKTLEQLLVAGEEQSAK